jgi:hypothetical protein
MKIRKLIALSLGSAAAMAALAGCPKPGATADQLEAVEKVLKGTSVTESGQGAPVLPDTPTLLEGYKNVYLTLLKSKKQKVSSGEKLDVTVEWSYDSALEPYVRELINKDNEHDVLKFKYGHKKTDEHGDITEDAPDQTRFTLKATAKSGEATLTKEFLLDLNHNDNIYDNVTLAELYAKNEAGTNFAFMDGTSIKGNHKQTYYYVAVAGKLEYLSPDGNWGLLSDGNHMMELYQLTKSTDYDVAVANVGDYIKVYADVSQYKGNVQVAYCNFIEKLTDHSAIAPRVDYGELPENMNVAGEEDFVPFYAGINNMNGTLTGVTVKSGEFASFNKGGRFTFVVTKGSQDFTIAYDYHVGANDSDVGNELDRVIKSLAIGNTITVKGTIRYCNDAGIAEGGEYQLTPYRLGDIAKVS